MRRGRGQHAAGLSAAASAEPSSDGAKTPCTCMRQAERAEDAMGRLPGDCDLGAGPGEEKLAAITQRKIKAPGLDSGGKKVLG